MRGRLGDLVPHQPHQHPLGEDLGGHGLLGGHLHGGGDQPGIEVAPQAVRVAHGVDEPAEFGIELFHLVRHCADLLLSRRPGCAVRYGRQEFPTAIRSCPTSGAGPSFARWPMARRALSSRQMSLALPALLLLLALLAPLSPLAAGRLPKERVPAPLKPWADWALRGHESELCPFFL